MERAADVVIGATFDDSFDTVIDDAQERVEELGDELDDALGGGNTRSRDFDLGGFQRGLDDSIAATRQQREQMRAGAMDAIALGASIYGLVRPAMNFESAMADVAKVMGLEAGTEDYDAIYDSILRLSEEIPISAEGFASIVESAGQMGLAGEEAIQFARDAARMGVAFDMTAEQAGNAMQAMRASLQLSQEEVLALGNTLNFVSNQAGVTAADLTDFMTTGGVQFAQGAGVAREELIALGSTLMEMDIPAGEAGTAMRNFFQTLTRGEHLEGNKAEVLRSIGLDPEQIAAQISQGGDEARAAVDTVLDQLAGVADEERAGILSAVFGAYGVSTVSALINARDRLGELRDLADADAGTSMLDEYETRAATTEFAMQSLMNTITTLSITIGSTLLPAIVDIVNTVAPVISSITELAGEFPMVTQAVVGTAMAFAALKVSSFALGYGWTFVKEGALQTARAMTFAYATATGQNWAAIGARLAPVGAAVRGIGTAFRVASIAMMTTPIGLIIGGIALAVGAAALTIRKYWEPLSNFFSGVWNGISSVVTEMGAGISRGLEPIMAALEPVQPVFDAIGSAVGAVVGWFSDLLTPVTQTEEQMQATIDAGTRVGEVIGTVLVGAIDTLLTPLRVGVWAFQTWSSALSNIYEWFSTLGPRIMEFGGEILEVFNEEGFIAAGRALMTGLWNGMRSIFADIVGWFSDRIAALVDMMPEWVTDALGIERQERVLTDVEIDQRVAEGLEDFNEPRFNSRDARREAEAAALAQFADDEQGTFWGTSASDEVLAQREAFVQAAMERAEQEHAAAVEAARAAEEARIRTELMEANNAILEARQAEIAEAVGEGPPEPAAPVINDTQPEPVIEETVAVATPGVFEPAPEPTITDPMPVAVVTDPAAATATPAPRPEQAPPPEVTADAEAAVADIYRQGADILYNAMSQAVALESARAAALAAERPRSVTANVQAPITVNNYGSPDAGGAAVRNGVYQGADDILAAERDGYID